MEMVLAPLGGWPEMVLYSILWSCLRVKRIALRQPGQSYENRHGKD